MTIQNIYNYKHLLAKVPLMIRAFYVLPAFLLLIVSNSTLFYFCLFAVFLLMNRYISKIKFSRLLQLYKYPLFFILTGCITIAISFGVENPLVSINNIDLGIDQTNALVAQTIFFRSLAILSIVWFYLLTHTISEISEVMHKCKLPDLLVELFVLSYKFINNLWSAGKNMLIAQNCRLAYSSRGNKIYTASLLIAAIFRKAIIQTSQLEIASDSRLGEGNFYFLNPHREYFRKQWIGPIVTFACLTGLFLICKNYG